MPRAVEVFADAFFALGAAVAPWVLRFGATDLVLGGSVSRSWDVVVPPLLEGLGAAGASPRVVPAARLDEAAFLGAALAALRGRSESPSPFRVDVSAAMTDAAESA